MLVSRTNIVVLLGVIDEDLGGEASRAGVVFLRAAFAQAANIVHPPVPPWPRCFGGWCNLHRPASAVACGPGAPRCAPPQAPVVRCHWPLASPSRPRSATVPHRRKFARCSWERCRRPPAASGALPVRLRSLTPAACVGAVSATLPAPALIAVAVLVAPAAAPAPPGSALLLAPGSPISLTRRRARSRYSPIRASP